MAIDSERNRVLVCLRDQSAGGTDSGGTDSGGTDSGILGERLSLAKEDVERHLLYCADRDLAKWKRIRNGLGCAVITDRGRDYLTRQGL